MIDAFTKADPLYRRANRLADRTDGFGVISEFGKSHRYVNPAIPFCMGVVTTIALILALAWLGQNVN